MKNKGKKLEQYMNVGHCFEHGMNSGKFEQVMFEQTSFKQLTTSQGHSWEEMVGLRWNEFIPYNYNKLIITSMYKTKLA